MRNILILILNTEIYHLIQETEDKKQEWHLVNLWVEFQV